MILFSFRRDHRRSLLAVIGAFFGHVKENPIGSALLGTIESAEV
jgi:hypothetical protein